MKKTLMFALAAMALASCSNVQTSAPVFPADPQVEAKVKQVMSELTLEEKIGQMTQITIDLFGRLDSTGAFQFYPGQLDKLIGQYKVGSFLNVPSTSQTPEAWYNIIEPLQKMSIDSIGVPTIYGLDQNHGATYTTGATFFPQNVSLAASFDVDVAERAASIAAYETRASNCPWTFCPTLDLGRDPRWPRIYENFGEDALVNAEMGCAQVRGFQGNDPNHVDKYHIAACLKHFMGYGVPFSGKDRTPAYISPQDLREKHFAPYLAAITEGALSVMVNSGSVNGKPLHANAELLTQWLKVDLGWDGVIVTDWADIDNLWKREKVAANKKDAICMAINAGIDMSMDPYNTDFCELLKELVDEGKVPMSRIDDAAARVVRMKVRLGLFDQPNTKWTDYPDFGCQEYRDFALKAAEECIVLLKNQGNILPLQSGKRILVTGPNGNSMRTLNGGWSYTWQGNLTEEFAKEYNTIYEALANKYGADKVTYVPGVEYNHQGAYYEEKTSNIAAAVAAARSADYIVACIGENSYTETPGNLTDLNLSANQLQLVSELAKTGKPIILVLNEGRPRLISSIEPLASAVIDAILPGNYGGDALANLMAGDANFSARMPFTYPKEINSLVTYDYKVSEEVETMEGAYDYNAVVASQWAFGFGLSYTTFRYSNFSVDKPNFSYDDTLKFSVEIENVGAMAGKEAALLFSTDLVASQVPDNRRLRSFTKIELQPGQKQMVTFELPAYALAFVDGDGKWVIEEGDFRMQVGDQVLNVHCDKTHKWQRPNINI